MGYMHQIIETEPHPAIWIRKVTDLANLPKEIGEAYNTILAYLNEVGEQPLGPAFIAYYNMDMENLEIEIGFPVSREIPGKEPMVVGYIPGGKAASSFYKGAYNCMGACYDEIITWLNKRECIPTGVVYEFYYNSPTEVPESELLTEIRFLLK